MLLAHCNANRRQHISITYCWCAEIFCRATMASKHIHLNVFSMEAQWIRRRAWWRVRIFLAHASLAHLCENSINTQTIRGCQNRKKKKTINPHSLPLLVKMLYNILCQSRKPNKAGKEWASLWPISAWANQLEHTFAQTCINFIWYICVWRWESVCHLLTPAARPLFEWAMLVGDIDMYRKQKNCRYFLSSKTIKGKQHFKRLVCVRAQHRDYGGILLTEEL